MFANFAATATVGSQRNIDISPETFAAAPIACVRICLSRCLQPPPSVHNTAPTSHQQLSEKNVRKTHEKNQKTKLENQKKFLWFFLCFLVFSIVFFGFRSVSIVVLNICAPNP
jgi:hypothetical protein